jgi:hypothetical protein
MSTAMHVKTTPQLNPSIQEQTLPVYFSQTFYVTARQTSLNELVPLAEIYLHTQIS